MKDFKDVIKFHGHACPGLALGYRVAKYVLKEFQHRSKDEELVAIVENNSCAVDAIQVMLGCTFGKGNLIFRDYGKQVYTFIDRRKGNAIRIAVDWRPPQESEKEKEMWQRYAKGDQSEEVLKFIHNTKSKKIKTILNSTDSELLKIKKLKMKAPEGAKIYPSIRCSICNEKVMETKARIKNGSIVCIPCFEKD
jgi:formylmethanofuran dehydrogenase subunit E